MNYPTIEAKEYAQRVHAIRAKMDEKGVDILVGFSNLLEIGIVRYHSQGRGSDCLQRSSVL